MVVHLKHSIGCCWTNSWYLWLPNSQNLPVATSSRAGRAGPLEPLPHTQLIGPVFCWPGVRLHWVQLHRVHDKNGLVIPRRWHPSSCLQLLPFSHSLVSESSYSWLNLWFPIIPSTVNSHVFASTTFHCRERLVQGSSAVPPEMPLHTIAPLSDTFNQINQNWGKLGWLFLLAWDKCWWSTKPRKSNGGPRGGRQREGVFERLGVYVCLESSFKLCSWFICRKKNSSTLYRDVLQFCIQLRLYFNQSILGHILRHY